MRRLLPFVGFVFAGLCGCADSHAGLMRESVSAMTDAADALETAKDEASAKAAIPALESFATRLDAIAERQLKLDAKAPPTEEEQQALKEIREKELVEVRRRLDENALRIRGTPAAYGALHAVLTKISEAARHRGSRFSLGFLGMPPPPAAALVGFRAPPSRAAAVERFEQQYGKEKIATVLVHKVPAGRFKEVVDRVKAAAGAKGQSANGSGTSATIVVAPVDDLEALASSLDFGTVTNVDAAARQITIEADPSKL